MVKHFPLKHYLVFNTLFGENDAWGSLKYAGCSQMTFRNIRDILNQQCRTTEQISSSMQWLDVVGNALGTAKTSKLEIGVAQTLVDVPPRVGIYSTVNEYIHSVQVKNQGIFVLHEFFYTKLFAFLNHFFQKIIFSI